ncbi:MAG TPA: hypothetical protein VER55_10290, partial [Ardenticatenaceae bacterium]|nr:hypothetical protein [Ardenticatenaceae bacterium]
MSRIARVIGILILVVVGLVPRAAGPLGAQGGVRILEVAPIQVLEGFPLVLGKETVVRVAVAAEQATDATMTVTFDANEYRQEVRLSPGEQWVDFFVEAPSSPGPMEVAAAIAGDAGEAASVEALVVSPARSLKLFYLPVDWMPEERGRFGYDEVIPRFVELQTEFLEGIYPIPAGFVESEFSQTPHMLAPGEKAVLDPSGVTDSRVLALLYGTVYAAGRRQAPDADLIVAILPPDWFRRYYGEDFLGLAYSLVPGLVLSQIGRYSQIHLEDEHPVVTSHEIGHVFLLPDEYDNSVVPPKNGERLDVPGYWVARREAKEDSELTPTFNFMSRAGLTDYWVRGDTYIHLLKQLTDWDGESGLQNTEGGPPTREIPDLSNATAEIRMATALDEQNEPVELATSFPPDSEKIWASITVTNVPQRV